MNLSKPELTKTYQSPTVKVISRTILPERENVACLTVLDRFLQNPAIFAIPIVNDKFEPVGIIDRRNFVEIFLKQFAREVYSRKSISEFIADDLISVELGTTIDDVSQIIINKGMQHMMSGFIITENGYYTGIADGHDLLNEIMRKKQENLFYLAHFDQLTNLPNRLLCMDRLSKAIEKAKRKKSSVGLLFIDLDNFKNFNDSMGHGFGDQILIAAANRLVKCSREEDTVSRISGDEFVIILEEAQDQKILNHLCNRIIEEMKLPLEIMGRNVYITVSIGTAMFPQNGNEINDLILKADAAMYEAKRAGRNAFIPFTAGMRMYSLDKMTLETDLRLAIERKEFELYYQPQIDANTGEIVCVEALIRWNHPERGILTPINFIEIAEKTGLIIPIGKWVIEEACRQHQEWRSKGHSPLRIAVNISPMQFYQNSFNLEIQSVLIKTSMPPSHLELELTEGMFMHNVENVIKVLNELHHMGVRLSIDDFGTGYSNLSYLRRFPIDKLKVDQSFVRGIDKETVNKEILNTIVVLAKHMNLELVAEGVETDKELVEVKKCGCHLVQGFNFSKPLPPNQFLIWRTEYEAIHAI